MNYSIKDLGMRLINDIIMIITIIMITVIKYIITTINIITRLISGLKLQAISEFLLTPNFKFNKNLGFLRNEFFGIHWDMYIY